MSVKAEDNQEGSGVKTEGSPVPVSLASVIEAVLAVINAERLAYLSLKGWILFVREDFDMFHEGEPHHAISFLFHMDTRRFLSRVWGKTLSQGKVHSLDQLAGHLRVTFERTMPCMGLKRYDPAEYEECVSLPIPFPLGREVSKQCTFKVKHNQQQRQQASICEPCKVVKNIQLEYGNDFEAYDDEPMQQVEDEADSEDRDLKSEPANSNNHQTSESPSALRERPKRTLKSTAPAIPPAPSITAQGNPTFTPKASKLVSNASPEQKLIALQVSLPFSCKFCYKVFKSRNFIRNHMLRMHAYGSFVCPCCRSKFPTMHHMLDHLEESHPSTTDFSCPVCQSTLSTLEEKKSIVHFIKCTEAKRREKIRAGVAKEKERDWPCSQCDLVFESRARRDNHFKKEHAREKWVVCDECGFSTPNKQQLAKHKVAHLR